MGGDGGGILRHINPHPARTHACFAEVARSFADSRTPQKARQGRRRRCGAAIVAAAISARIARSPRSSRSLQCGFGISTSHQPRICPSVKPVARSRDTDPQASAALPGDPVSRTMAANAHRLHDDRPEHSHFAFAIDRETVDIACKSAGVSLNQGRGPGRGCVGGVTEAIAGSSARNALAPCDAPAHGRRVRVARCHGRSRPSARQAFLQLSKQSVVHAQDDEIRTRYDHPETRGAPPVWTTSGTKEATDRLTARDADDVRPTRQVSAQHTSFLCTSPRSHADETDPPLIEFVLSSFEPDVFHGSRLGSPSVKLGPSQWRVSRGVPSTSPGDRPPAAHMPSRRTKGTVVD